MLVMVTSRLEVMLTFRISRIGEYSNFIYVDVMQYPDRKIFMGERIVVKSQQQKPEAALSSHP